MDRRLTAITLWVMMAGIVLILVGCGAQGSTVEPFVMPKGMTPDWASGPPIPTPDYATAEPPCSKPTWIVGKQKVCRFLVTPLPGEKIRVGMITLLAQPVPPPTDTAQSRYAIREDIPPWQPVTKPGQYIPSKKLFVKDSVTGREIRLGDDGGDALFEAMTSQYVIWRYQWDGRSETLRKTGLYAYVLETSDEIIIAQQPDTDPWHPEIDGQWVLYVDDAQDTNKYFTKLRVHNLTTGEAFLLGKKVPDYSKPPSNYYAINDDKIAWVEAEKSWTVRVYDLATHTTRILNVPNTDSPEMISISGDIVVWFDKFWRGYDLQQDALFTIPTVPPGWENVSVQPASPVTVKDDQLYWALSVNDKVYHFTAPILRGR